MNMHSFWVMDFLYRIQVCLTAPTGDAAGRSSASLGCGAPEFLSGYCTVLTCVSCTSVRAKGKVVEDQQVTDSNLACVSVQLLACMKLIYLHNISLSL